MPSCYRRRVPRSTELTVFHVPAAERYFYDVCGDDGHDVGSHVRSIFWTLYAIALTCFGSRMVARTRRFGGKFWFDDWFIVASFVVLTAVSIGAEISKFSFIFPKRDKHTGLTRRPLLSSRA